jgi:hypothetical protein
MQQIITSYFKELKKHLSLRPMYFLFNQYQPKHCVINDIVKIGVNTFADDGLPFIGNDLLNA